MVSNEMFINFYFYFYRIELYSANERENTIWAKTNTLYHS